MKINHLILGSLILCISISFAQSSNSADFWHQHFLKLESNKDLGNYTVVEKLIQQIPNRDSLNNLGVPPQTILSIDAFEEEFKRYLKLQDKFDSIESKNKKSSRTVTQLNKLIDQFDEENLTYYGLLNDIKIFRKTIFDETKKAELTQEQSIEIMRILETLRDEKGKIVIDEYNQNSPLISEKKLEILRNFVEEGYEYVAGSYEDTEKLLELKESYPRVQTMSSQILYHSVNRLISLEKEIKSKTQSLESLQQEQQNTIDEYENILASLNRDVEDLLFIIDLEATTRKFLASSDDTSSNLKTDNADSLFTLDSRSMAKAQALQNYGLFLANTAEKIIDKTDEDKAWTRKNWDKVSLVYESCQKYLEKSAQTNHATAKATGVSANNLITVIDSMRIHGLKGVYVSLPDDLEMPQGSKLLHFEDNLYWLGDEPMTPAEKQQCLNLSSDSAFQSAIEKLASQKISFWDKISDFWKVLIFLCLVFIMVVVAIFLKRNADRSA